MDKLILLLLISTAFVVAQAKVVLPSYITDNMVVQRNSVMKITGHASSGSKVNVIAGWDSRSREVKADSEGKFDISLDTPDAGGPYSIIIADKDSKVKVGNVLSGELWLCSGQSNMEFPVDGWTSVMDADHVVSTARNPDIRLLQVKKRVAFSPQDDIETNMGGWVEAAPNTMDFSAIAYLYAKELRDSLKVPVGVIDATWGGTPAEAWTSYGFLKGVPGFEGELSAMESCGFDASRLRENYEKEMGVWMKLAQKGGEEIRPGDKLTGNVLPAEAMVAEVGSVIIPLGGDWTYKVGVDFSSLPKKPASIEGSSYPTVLYNAMIHPLRNLPIKGVLWYQGCANVGRAEQYETLFKSLINNWRDTWDSEFPFYFVQLAGWLAPQSVQPDSEWAALRNAQSKALQLPNTAMVSAIDLGNPGDIHPRDKQTVAHRLALTALGRDYGFDTNYKAPQCISMQKMGNKIVLKFDDDLTVTSVAILGFIIGNADGDFDQAVARMADSRTLELYSPLVKKPVCVRYDWADFPNGNLYSLHGIPVAPFATDK